MREMEGGIFCGLFPRLSEFVRVALVGSYDSLREMTYLILDKVLCARSSFLLPSRCTYLSLQHAATHCNALQ